MTIVHAILERVVNSALKINSGPMTSEDIESLFRTAKRCIKEKKFPTFSETLQAMMLSRELIGIYDRSNKTCYVKQDMPKQHQALVWAHEFVHHLIWEAKMTAKGNSCIEIACDTIAIKLRDHFGEDGLEKIYKEASRN